MRPVIQVACRNYDPIRSPRSIRDAFNVIKSVAFPASPRFDLVFCMQLDAEDIGRSIDYALRVIQPDGLSLDGAATTHTIQVAEPGRPEWWWPNFEVNFAFPNAGTYELHLLIDGESVGFAEVEFVHVSMIEAFLDEER